MLDRLWAAYRDQGKQLIAQMRENAVLREVAQAAEEAASMGGPHTVHDTLREALARYHDLQADQ